MPERRKPPSQSFTVERRTSNRRAFPRWPAQFEVRVGHGRDLVEARGRQIGEGGIFFESNHLYPLDTEVEVEYRLSPNDDWVRLKAVVKHMEGRTIGVEFLNLKLHDRLKIVEFVSRKK